MQESKLIFGPGSAICGVKWPWNGNGRPISLGSSVTSINKVRVTIPVFGRSPRYDGPCARRAMIDS
jgi:hypothetical protein